MKKHKFLCAVSTLLVLSFAACNQTNTNTTNKASNGGTTTGGNVRTGVKPAPDAQVVVIATADYGRIVIELYPNIAPQMVERFKKLINEHFYDGTAIHRIDPNLGIIQGGDPLTKKANATVWAQVIHLIPTCRPSSAIFLMIVVRSAPRALMISTVRIVSGLSH